MPAHRPTRRDILLQVISQRYEQASIVLTTNKACKTWPSIFSNDSSITSAVPDRLHKHGATQSGQPYNEVWCVFDRDSFPLENYDRAFQRARAEGIKVAWTNEAFELWYLLHYNYHDSGISRHDYKTKLRACLKSGLRRD